MDGDPEALLEAERAERWRRVSECEPGSAEYWDAMRSAAEANDLWKALKMAELRREHASDDEPDVFGYVHRDHGPMEATRRACSSAHSSPMEDASAT
jgi:hypothetical protein